MLTVTSDGGKTKMLGQVFTAFTGTEDGFRVTDTGTAAYASLGAAPGAAVGSYDITATFTFANGAESNYQQTEDC
jgi:MBG domain (YGX type)